jgi:hypothetical protein
MRCTQKVVGRGSRVSNWLVSEYREARLTICAVQSTGRGYLEVV